MDSLITLFERQTIPYQALGLTDNDPFLETLDRLNKSAGKELIRLERKGLRATQFVGQQLHGTRKEGGVGAGRVHEIGRVDGDRPHAKVRQAATKGVEFDRRLGATDPGRRVVGEDLERVGADGVGALDGLDHAAGQGQVRSESSAVGKHPRHRTMPAHAPGAVPSGCRNHPTRDGRRGPRHAPDGEYRRGSR